MSKISQRVTATLFCVFLAGLGLLHLLLPDRGFSPVENRNLKQTPAFSWPALADGSYTAALETYLADQFPFRDSWMGLKTRYERLLGKREFHGVYLCGDTLISKVSNASYGDRNLDFLHELGGLVAPIVPELNGVEDVLGGLVGFLLLGDGNVAVLLGLPNEVQEQFNASADGSSGNLFHGVVLLSVQKWDHPPKTGRAVNMYQVTANSIRVAIRRSFFWSLRNSVMAGMVSSSFSPVSV